MQQLRLLGSHILMLINGCYTHSVDLAALWLQARWAGALLYLLPH